MHPISIPKEIIDSCIKRRGRLHVFEKINPLKTALIVIDMQNSWVKPNMSVLEIPKTRGIINNINEIAEALRTAGGHVIWTKSTFNCEWTPQMYEKYADRNIINKMMEETSEEHDGFQIYEKMEYKSQDIICKKYRPSAFIQGSSDIEKVLKEKGCDTLIISGTLTNACCESSARDAAALGYKVLFLSDGTATRTDIEHNAALINLMQLVADVRTTGDVIDLIKKT
tara:strand:- start:1921 stop:2598 length:678 start_codon:yes stop_codon:yes gene_type:complete